MQRMKRIGGLMLLCALWIGAIWPQRFVWTYETGTQALWNSHELYLIVGAHDQGWSGRGFQVALNIGRELLTGWPAGAQRSHPSVTVIVVTASELEQHAFEGMEAPSCTPWASTLYCRAGGKIKRWTGAMFEEVSDDGLRQAANARSFGEFENIDGWSKRVGVCSGLTPRVVTATLDGMAIKVIGSTVLAPRSHTQLELVRPDGTTTTVWGVDNARRSVTAAEYDRLFR